uniref:Kisspeptin 2 n=1 Tax=Echeneis naucrates TaxID=173247 RepID=A0A665WAI1_ECHNA
MRRVALVVVCMLIVGQDGGNVGADLPGYESAQRTGRGFGSALSLLRKRTADFLDGDTSLCVSLRENQPLCNDRRSQFNFNPFGLRFGKRYSGYIGLYRRANKLSPNSMFPRELEVPT